MKIYLDLLPNDRKNELKRKKNLWTIIRLEVLFLFPIIIFMVILLDAYFILGIQKESAVSLGSEENAQVKYQELRKYEDKFKETNELAVFLSRAENDHLHWSRLIDKISAIVPEGVYLSEFSTKEYQAFLLGKAKSRDDLIKFKEAIVSSGCADEVNVPLANLVTRTDVDFQIDFKVKQECIKDKIK